MAKVGVGLIGCGFIEPLSTRGASAAPSSWAWWTLSTSASATCRKSGPRVRRHLQRAVRHTDPREIIASPEILERRLRLHTHRHQRSSCWPPLRLGSTSSARSRWPPIWSTCERCVARWSGRASCIRLGSSSAIRLSLLSSSSDRRPSLGRPMLSFFRDDQYFPVAANTRPPGAPNYRQAGRERSRAQASTT